MDVSNTEFLCGGFSCTKTLSSNKATTSVELLSEKGDLCNKVTYSFCDNIIIDEEICADQGSSFVSLLSDSYSSIDEHLLCDERCDMVTCEDEANCNRLRYGIYCRNRFHPLKRFEYIPTIGICDDVSVCLDGEDEQNCTVTVNDYIKTCVNSYGNTKVPVPLKNITRCFLTELTRVGFNYSYCTNFMDQTNCTDKSRVGVTCKINNFTSTVSKYMMCANQAQLCDDGMENLCVDASFACTVHKHRLCDGITDCQEETDESNHLCADMTDGTCVRAASTDNIPRKIPLAWLQDGIVDCLDGKDEEPIWPSCGVGDTWRHVVESSQDSCENVFLCPDSGYVQYKDMCDGFESCGVENSICKVSRGYPDLYTTERKAITDGGIFVTSSFCLKGIEEVRFLQNVQCHKEPFRFPSDIIFGVPKKNSLFLPSFQHKCDNLFGENYVYSCCTGHCLSSKCPLEITPKYDSCPGQFKNRVGSLVGTKYLTFLTKTHGVYHNNYFVCRQTAECLDYSKVCDLVEDCRDGSDEAGCTNHFKCGNTSHYIPITKFCDGIIDCLDTSDECNERCSKRILNGRFLRASAWLMAVFAVIGNCQVMRSELSSVRKSTNINAFANKNFIILIAVGDLLTGIYLLWIAMADSFVFGVKYCKIQWAWLTSSDCSILGVISTTGNLISIFQWQA